MVLIIESGATKTDWCAVGKDKDPVFVRTAGINLATMPEAAIKSVVDEAVGAFSPSGALEGLEEVHFYAAALIVREEETVPVLAAALDKVFRGLFPDALIEYASDT
ncbi:MAG: hypothetical protein IK076_04210, partial [Bacteroidales bacterium]|nr:hypothetical protein [Bacteroidales bacterium]